MARVGQLRTTGLDEMRPNSELCDVVISLILILLVFKPSLSFRRSSLRHIQIVTAEEFKTNKVISRSHVPDWPPLSRPRLGHCCSIMIVLHSN